MKAICRLCQCCGEPQYCAFNDILGLWICHKCNVTAWKLEKEGAFNDEL